MKRICIIYTGGTIGMERGENGYEPGKEPFSESSLDFPVQCLAQQNQSTHVINQMFCIELETLK